LHSDIANPVRIRRCDTKSIAIEEVDGLVNFVFINELLKISIGFVDQRLVFGKSCDGVDQLQVSQQFHINLNGIEGDLTLFGYEGNGLFHFFFGCFFKLLSRKKIGYGKRQDNADNDDQTDNSKEFCTEAHVMKTSGVHDRRNIL